MTVPQTAAEPVQQPQPKRRGMTGSAKSMIISMVILLVAVLGWIALVPRVDKVDRPGVDIAGIARETGLAQKWTVSYPQPAPKGWIPANVRLVTFQNQPPTWQAGYDLPNSKYIAVEQTDKPTKVWTDQQTNYGTAEGTVEVAGATWTKVRRASNDQSSLVRTEPLNGLATVVTGRADWSELQQFASLLKPTAAS